MKSKNFVSGAKNIPNTKKQENNEKRVIDNNFQ